jgi:hypothetical protein
MTNTKIFLIVSTLLFSSCSEGTSHSGLVNHNQKEQKMVSTKSDKSNDNTTSIYKLQFNNNLSRIKAGDDFTLSFSPKYKYDDSKIVELETIHEQKAHLIIVSEDLEYFNHVHPTRVDNGEYSLQMNLPYGGSYKLYVEYKPEGSKKITDVFDLEAEGNEKPKMIFNSEKLSFNLKDISVSLQGASEIYSGSELQFPVLIMKDGKKIKNGNLDNYLGEKAHAVMIGFSDMEMLHIHPMVINDMLYLHSNYDDSGIYRLWVQFKIEGVLHTADFVLYVKPFQHSEKKTTNNQHNNH